MNYAVEQRLRFIDFCLKNYGYTNRVIHCDFFGVGEATATRDFREYEKINPKSFNLVQSDKSYHRSKEFSPAY